MSPLTMVLADGHAAVRKSLCALLECEQDIRIVAEANDGVEAIRAVHSLQPDLLVLDIKLPLMNGLEVLQYLRNEKHPLGIIILSNHTEQLYVAAASRLGADAFLTKSAGIEALLEAIRIVRQRLSGDQAERLARSGASLITRGEFLWTEPRMDLDLTHANSLRAVEKSA